MGRNSLDVIAGVVWFGFALSHATAQGQGLGGGLELEDFGSFYIHGHVIENKNAIPQHTGDRLIGAGQITVGQMYVQYMIPQRTVTLPMVLVHGANHTGKTFETTRTVAKAGRRTLRATAVPSTSWIMLAAAVPASMRPRSIAPRPPTTRPALPAVLQYPRAGAWINFRFGPEFESPFSDLQFPLEAIDQLGTDRAEYEKLSTATPGIRSRLLPSCWNRIGPAVALVHSQSGASGSTSCAMAPRSPV